MPVLAHRSRDRAIHAMPTEGDLRWRVREGAELHWRSWGEEHVVYEGFSGSTHLLDSVAAAVLHSLERSPAGAAELASAVAGLLAVARDEALLRYVERTLRALERLELIEPVS